MCTPIPKKTMHGFTLVELLVVIAIIGILVSLLLPAVQAAREAGRRAQCQNNIKQIMLALHNYHDTHKGLPPAIMFNSGDDPSTSDNLKPNWIITILPFIELQGLFESFKFKNNTGAEVFVSDPLNRVPRGMKVKTLQCPSDPNSDNYPFAGTTSGEGDNWARGNYAANGTLGFVGAGNGGTNYGWDLPDQKGVMACNKSMNMAGVTDGLSNTIFMAEIKSGLTVKDRRGTWALGTAGASALFKHGFGGDANGPNAIASASDDIEGCGDFYNIITPVQLSRRRMGCCNGCTSWQQTARGEHPGGVLVGIGDGSVRFIPDTVEHGAPFESTLYVWDHLNNSSAGVPVTLPQ